MKNSIYMIALGFFLMLSCNNNPRVAVNEQLQGCVDQLSDCIENCSCVDRCPPPPGKGKVNIEDPKWQAFLDCFNECREKGIHKGTKAECRKSCQQDFFECVKSNG